MYSAVVVNDWFYIKGITITQIKSIIKKTNDQILAKTKSAEINRPYKKKTFEIK